MTLSKIKCILLVILVVAVLIAISSIKIPTTVYTPTWEQISNCKLLLEMERDYHIPFDPEVKEICVNWGITP